MFHRSYIPSHLANDDEANAQRHHDNQPHQHQQHQHYRSSSLDFELYTPRSPNLHHLHHHQLFHYNNDHQDQNQQRHRSASAAVVGATTTTASCGELVGNDNQPIIQWFLFQSRGTISLRLSTETPILIGSGSECDIRFLTDNQSAQQQQQQSPYSSSSAAAVEKRHAVLAFEPSSNCFTVKDLNTTNGTYVNNRRLCADHPETVSNLDVLRFGYDIHFILQKHRTIAAKATDASLSTAGAGAGLGGIRASDDDGPSSLPVTLNNYNKCNGPFSNKLNNQLSRSISTEDNHYSSGSRAGLPPKGNSLFGGGGGSGAVNKSGGSPYLPRKSLLTVTKSDPGGGKGEGNIGSGIFSDRLAQYQRRNSGNLIHETSNNTPAGFNPENKQCGGDRIPSAHHQNTPNNVMQQGGRSGTSGVCSPSLTLDSGRGSSSAPSSPAKEMSPVQMMATATSATSPTGGPAGGASSIGTASSNQSNNGSPVFARKLSRPMEYLLGQQQPSSGGNADSNAVVAGTDYMADPHYSVGLSSGNYTSFCTSGSEPISFATTNSSGGVSGVPSSATASGNLNNNSNLNCGGFPSSDCCEILHITEDFDEDTVPRKDSLEEEEADAQRRNNNQVMLNGDNDTTSAQNVQPQFLVGGDIMLPDLNVPNEVFGPLSHAEILNRNNVNVQAHNIVNANLNNSQHSSSPTGRQETNHNNKPVLVDGYTTNHHHAPRARSSSGGEGGGGGGGGSNRSTPLSALYGTPHWWPDSPPSEENCCPPPPASSTNASPFKKPFLLNNINNTYNNSRLKGNSSSSSLADQVAKDLSLESTHSHQSGSHNVVSSSSPGPPPPNIPSPPSSSSLEETNRTDSGATTMAGSKELKKLTPMAFTIDFGDNSETGGGVSGSASNEAVEAKKAAIAERLSKFAPRHRRNASLTKSDEVVVVGAEPVTASSLPKQTKCSSNSLGRTQTSQHQQRQSSVSAAESSSTKCASLPKKLSSLSNAIGGASISKHPSGGSNNDSGLRSLSPETISSTTSSSSRSRPVIDSKNSSSARKVASDNNNLNGSMGRKSGASVSSSTNNKNQSGSRSGTPATRRTPGNDGLRSSYRRDGGEKPDNKTAKAAAEIPQLNDLSKESPVSVPPPPPVLLDKEDTVSEAGTYTVEKETPDVQNARENIEDVFGLNGDDEMDKENNLANVALASGNENNKSFGGAEPGTRDWVREWAELAAQQHQQKKRERPELPDSQYFLRETETLVSAIQERVSKHMKSGGGGGGSVGGAITATSLGGAAGSDSDDDEPTLSHHTPVKSQSQRSTPTNTNKRRPNSRTSPFHRESSVLSDSGYAIGYQSDSSNEGSTSRGGRGSDLLISHSQHGIVTNKMNRAFNIRRGGRNFGYESTEPLLMMNNQQSMTTTTTALNNARGISPRPPQHQVNSLNKCSNVGANNSTSSPHFARNDGGRFSLRMPKSRTPPAQMPPPAPRQNSYTAGGTGEPHHGRVMMNGHKSSDSREQSVGSSSGCGGKKYTATGKVINNVGVGAGSNKKSSAGNRSNSTLTAKEVELANWKRRKNYDPMKAAAEGKKGGKKNGGAESGVEESAPLPPIASPKVNRREAMMTKSLSFHQESYSPKCPSEDEDMIYIVDEMDSSHSNSPNHLGGGSMTRSYHEDAMYYGMSSSAAMRPKNKLEALDNLVIATIHSLSNKVRTSSRHLLEKLQTQHASDENGALLEEMVSQLKELEGPSNNASPNKSPSRELSGTLKNLKKLEQVVLVLDKVLCDGFESDVNG